MGTHRKVFGNICPRLLRANIVGMEVGTSSPLGIGRCRRRHARPRARYEALRVKEAEGEPDPVPSRRAVVADVAAVQLAKV